MHKYPLKNFGCAAVTLLLLTTSAHACNVPVFRYALERWQADPYEVIVFHRGPLAASHADAIASLEKAALAARANLIVERVDLDDKPDEDLLKLYERQKQADLPLLVVRFPTASRNDATIWAGPPGSDMVKSLIDSPARRELVQRIGTGETVVWLLLESGDRAKDDAAAQVLQTRLEKLKSLLKLPELTDAPVDRVSPEGPPLKIAFSVLRLSRKDAAEAMLIRQLLLTEDDLHDKKEPIAFPVFGRGRALYAMIGKGINEDTIDEASAFLVGPCSCQVKRLNPGTDLLIAADWDALLEGKRVVKDKELPPLRGLFDFVRDSATATPELLVLPPRYEGPEPPPAEAAELLMFPPRCLDPVNVGAFVRQTTREPVETFAPGDSGTSTRPSLVGSMLLAVGVGLLIIGGLGIILWARTAR